MDKLDLLAKGWKVSEIEHASKILDEAERDKKGKTKFLENFLLIALASLMILNGFVCSTLLVPFIYGLYSDVILLVAATIGVVFSALFTIIIYDIEKIHQKHETNLFIAYIVNGVVNFYLILEFTARFGAQTNLPLENNVYIIAGTYLLAFLIPQIIHKVRRRNEIFDNDIVHLKQ
jgi:uncharacterized membrane-anchored protein